jgi:hypothetical protein
MSSADTYGMMRANTAAFDNLPGALEVLHSALVGFGLLSGLESAKVAPLSCPRVFLA